MRWRRARSGCEAALALIAVLAACHTPDGCRRRPRGRLTGEQAVDAGQRHGLERLLASAARGSLLPAEEILVVVDQRLVQDVLAASLPYERVIDDKYRVRITSAGVTFDDGFAVVRLEGRASLAQGGEAGVVADLSVVGGLDIVELDPASGTLRGRVKIIAVDARRVDVLGMRAPAERLVEDLSREGVEAFNVLASSIEIPVRLEREVALPAVGPQGGVQIAAAAVPVRLVVMDVKAFRGKLWVSIDAGTGTAPVAGAPASPPSPDAPEAARPARAGDQPARAELRSRLNERVAGDPLLVEAVAAEGEVLVAVRPDLIEQLIQEVAGRYLDHVTLDLDIGTDFHTGREVNVGTFLGKMKAGRWDLRVTVERVSGVLQARTPRVRFAEAGYVQIDLQVMLREAHGTAGVHFAWDAGGLAGAVCRDFEFRRRVRARVLPDEYTLAGAFRISSGAGALTAEPIFPRARFRLRVDLAPDSWTDVRQALEEQDQLLRCGMALDPEEMHAKLQEVLRKGFDVKLPRSLFRTVELPARFRGEVAVEERIVELDVRTNDLRVTPRAFWYSAAVRSRPRGGSATPGSR
jgi:hypothetical protein